jgi:hypothetical protein
VPYRRTDCALDLSFDTPLRPAASAATQDERSFGDSIRNGNTLDFAHQKRGPQPQAPFLCLGSRGLELAAKRYAIGARFSEELRDELATARILRIDKGCGGLTCLEWRVERNLRIILIEDILAPQFK